LVFPLSAETVDSLHIYQREPIWIEGNLKFKSWCSLVTFGYAVFVHTFIISISGRPPPLPHTTVLSVTSYLPACIYIPYCCNKFCAALCNTYSHISRKTLRTARSITH
jgi:hypothetical protein